MKTLNEQELTQIVGGKGNKGINWANVRCASAVTIGALGGGLAGPGGMVGGFLLGSGACL